MLNRSFWQHRRVFITGHTGFKGSWLSLWLDAMGAHVTGYALEPPTEPSLFEQATCCLIFEVRRHGTGHGGKRRHRPTKLVSGLAQPDRVPLPQGILNSHHMVRQASPKHLTNLLQGGGVAPAGGRATTGPVTGRLAIAGGDTT